MNRSALVSVITPFLNAKEFLREAVESVLCQTYENWELFLVDDGSSDSSTKVALDYALRHSAKVYCLAHEGHQNLGQSAARNLGLRQSKGEYVAFLDADDVWFPQKLERQVSTLNSLTEVGMVCGPSVAWHGSDPATLRPKQDAIYPLNGIANTTVPPPELLIRWYPLGRTTPTMSSLMVRWESITRIGGFDDALWGPQSVFDDQSFLAKIYLTSPVFVSGECLTRYRIHSSSCCGRATMEKQDAECLSFLKWLAGYIEEQGITDLRVRSALRRTLWRYEHTVVLGWARQAKKTWKQIAGQRTLRKAPGM